MAHPPGVQLMRLDSTGEQFYWSVVEQLYIFTGTGRRLTYEQLNYLIAQSSQSRPTNRPQATTAYAQQPRTVPSAASTQQDAYTTHAGTFSSSPTNSNNYVTGQGTAANRHASSRSQPHASADQRGQQVRQDAGFSAQATQRYFASSTANTGTTQSSSPRSSSGNVSQHSAPQPLSYSINAATRSGSNTAVSQSIQQASVLSSSGTAPRRNSASNVTQTGEALANMNLSSIPEQAVVPSFAGVRQFTGRDRQTGIAYNNLTGPADQITDPALRQIGVSASRKMLGTPGDTEEFDESYRVRKQPRKFFVRGKVFKVFWSEPAGDASDSVTDITRDARFGQNIHSKVRRFVVIREEDDYCSAIPIMTYRNRGLAKRNVKKSEFAVIYTGKTPPEIRTEEHPQPGEAPMRSAAIRVDSDERGAKLLPSSRVNFGKVYTIEHNVKVKSFGMINRDSTRDLLYQFREVWNEMFGSTGVSSGTRQITPAIVNPNSWSARAAPGASTPVQYQDRDQLRAALQSRSQQTENARSTQPQPGRAYHNVPGHSARGVRPVQRDESEGSSEEDSENDAE